MNGVNYDVAPWEIHDRSTVWTAAIYEILAKLVAEATPPTVKATLENAPTVSKGKAQMGMMQNMMQKMPSPQQNAAFEDYYAQGDNQCDFDAFFNAIVAASARVKGMMLRALQDIPPTGVTLLTLARVLYNADARLFPADPHPRELAKEVFQRRMLWVEDIDINAPGIGPSFEEPAHGGNAALMKAVYENADALRIPMSEGARILDPRISTVTRTIDAGNEQRGIGSKTVTERYLYYTYELQYDSCYITDDGFIEMGKVSIYKGGTLVMDENWNDVQLTTDPDLWIIPEEGTGEQPPEPAGVRAVNMAKQRFIKTHRQSLRAFRDGLVRPDGTLPSGQLALPFKVTRQSSGANLLIRNRCNLREHLLGVAGKHAHFPFEVD